MTQLLSVIVPIYNAGKYIRQCVSSIVNQKYNNIELILIDDGSTDNSFQICQELASLDSRIKVFKKENEGPSIARKYGLSFAKGDYINFVDADDYIDENMYTTLLSKAIESQADIVHCGHIVVKENGKIISKRELSNQIIEGNYNCSEYYARKNNVTNFLPDKIYKRKLFNDVVFPNLYTSEDACILTQIFGNSNLVITLSTPYYYYVMTENSLCRKEFSTQRLDSVKAGIFMYEYYKNNFPKLADLSTLYICSYAAQCYCHVSNTTWKNKLTLQKSLKNSFANYFNKEILRKNCKNISLNRWGLIKLFHINPYLCYKIVNLFKLLN